MTRESAPEGATRVLAAKRERSENSTAQDRARALGVNLEAVAAGIWAPTPDLFDALAGLAWAVTWDLYVGDMLALAS